MKFRGWTAYGSSLTGLTWLAGSLFCVFRDLRGLGNSGLAAAVGGSGRILPSHGLYFLFGGHWCIRGSAHSVRTGSAHIASDGGGEGVEGREIAGKG